MQTTKKNHISKRAEARSHPPGRTYVLPTPRSFFFDQPARRVGGLQRPTLVVASNFTADHFHTVLQGLEKGEQFNGVGLLGWKEPGPKPVGKTSGFVFGNQLTVVNLCEVFHFVGKELASERCGAVGRQGFVIANLQGQLNWIFGEVYSERIQDTGQAVAFFDKPSPGFGIVDR